MNFCVDVSRVLQFLTISTLYFVFSWFDSVLPFFRFRIHRTHLPHLFSHFFWQNKKTSSTLTICMCYSEHWAQCSHFITEYYVSLSSFINVRRGQVHYMHILDECTKLLFMQHLTPVCCVQCSIISIFFIFFLLFVGVENNVRSPFIHSTYVNFNCHLSLLPNSNQLKWLSQLWFWLGVSELGGYEDYFSLFITLKIERFITLNHIHPILQPLSRSKWNEKINNFCFQFNRLKNCRNNWKRFLN